MGVFIKFLCILAFLVSNIFCLEKSKADWCPEQIEGIWQYIYSDEAPPTFFEIKKIWDSEKGVVYHLKLSQNDKITFFPQEIGVLFVPDGMDYQFNIYTTKTTCDQGIMKIQLKTSFSNETFSFPTEMTVVDNLVFTLKKKRNGSLLLTAKGELNLTGFLNNISSEKFLYSYRTDKIIPASSFNSSRKKRNPTACPKIKGSFEDIYYNYHFSTQQKRGKFYYTVDIQPKLLPQEINQQQFKFVCGDNKFKVIENKKNKNKKLFTKNDITNNAVVYNNQGLSFNLGHQRSFLYQEDKHEVSILNIEDSNFYDFSFQNDNQVKIKNYRTWSTDTIFDYVGSLPNNK